VNSAAVISGRTLLRRAAARG